MEEYYIWACDSNTLLLVILAQLAGICYMHPPMYMTHYLNNSSNDIIGASLNPITKIELMHALSR